MVNPSASLYYPFDSEAPYVFLITNINNYIAVAFIILMVYDHVITFDKEVDWIWTLKWRLPKFLFLINRYVVCPLIVLIGVVDFIFPITLSFCDVIVHLAPGVAILTFGIAEAILIIRVCALYGQQKLFARFLTGIFALEMISAVVNTSLLLRETRQLYYYEFLPGCWSYLAHGVYSFWIPFTIFDGIIMFLTLYKVFPFRGGHGRTVSLLARDSIVYFVVLFSTMAINEIVYKLGIQFDLQLPSECIACISVSRMMMNIRGLAMDDPDNTVHLQTLRFASNGSSNAPHHPWTMNPESLPTPTINSATYEEG